MGEITADLLRRLIPETKVREPDLIILTSGINDVRRPQNKQNSPITPVAEFKSNILTMIDQARLLADVMFISTYPIKEKHDSSGNYLLPSDVAEYAGIVKTTCKEKHVPYLDIFSEWKTIDYNGLLIEDGVHANEAGHEKFFLSLKNFLGQTYH